jgi:MoaA/NifB/PqqE/SkfB family radical SAM enzyme
LLFPTDFPPLTRRRPTTLQVNLGYRCNQSCVHCHVDAGPKRREEMTAATLEQVLHYLRLGGTQLLDITGGAPELNAVFRPLVESARGLGLQVMDRCNLSILEEPGQADSRSFWRRSGWRSSPHCPVISVRLSMVSVARACSMRVFAVCGG